MRSSRFVLLKKWSIFTLCIFFFSIAQCTVGFLSILGFRPVFLLPLAVGFSMFLNQKDAAILGLVSGFFWDCFSGRLFGYSSLILIVICVFASLICFYIAHISLGNYVVLVFLGIFIYNFVDFVFRYMIWNFENSWNIWIYHIIPTVIYTILVSPIIYILCKFVFEKFVSNENTNYIR